MSLILLSVQIRIKEIWMLKQNSRRYLLPLKYLKIQKGKKPMTGKYTNHELKLIYLTRFGEEGLTQEGRFDPADPYYIFWMFFGAQSSQRPKIGDILQHEFINAGYMPSTLPIGYGLPRYGYIVWCIAV